MNINFCNRSLISLAILSSIALTGCLHDDDDDETSPSNNVSNVNISGKAAKGIIKGGIVTAEELSSAQAVIATVGTTTTDANGSYSLTLASNYQGGPVQVTISNDADTEMKCDVSAGCGTRTDGLPDTINPTQIDFGEWYKPASLTMTALMPDATANATVSVNITPFTHMAAERAKLESTLDAASIANANSEVSNLLGGIDILNTPPVDITDPVSTADASPTEATYAALSSALSNQGIVNADGQPDIDAALDLLVTSFSSGTIQADDEGDANDDSQISLAEIVTAAEDTLTASGTSDLTGVIAELNDDIATAESGDGTIDPEASSTATDDTLTQVKAMVADIRTWGTVIETEATAADTAFSTEIDLASNAIDALAMQEGPGSALAEAMEAISIFASGENTSSDLTTYLTSYDELSMMDVADFTAGTISSSTPGTITITDGVVFGYTVNVTASMPADQSSSTSLVIGIQSATVVSTNTTLTVQNGLVTMGLASAYTVDYEALDLGTAAPLPVVNDVTFDLDVSLVQSTGVDITGVAVALASPVTFTGGLAFDFDPVDIQNDTTSVNEGSLPRSFELNGTVSNATNSTDISLVINITNTGTFIFEGDFAPDGTLYSANHTDNFVEWSYTGDTFTYTSPVYTATYVYNSSTNDVAVDENFINDGFVFNNTYTAFGAATSIQDFVSQQAWLLGGYLYAEIDGEGSYDADLSLADFSVDGMSDGTLVDPEFLIGETTTNFIDADIGLTFTANLDGLPEASINITADRTGLDAGEITTNLSYGDRQLTFSMTGSEDSLGVTSVSGSVTITNQDNIVLTLSDANVDDEVPFTDGTLSFNGVVYGTVEDTGNFIKFTYSDGTFELF